MMRLASMTLLEYRQSPSVALNRSRVRARSLFEVENPRAVGQRVQELRTIRLGQDPGVEDRHDAGVGFRADQSTEALLELDDGLRYLIFDERVAAALADRLQAGLEQRAVRHA